MNNRSLRSPRVCHTDVPAPDVTDDLADIHQRVYESTGIRPGGDLFDAIRQLEDAGAFKPGYQGPPALRKAREK